MPSARAWWGMNLGALKTVRARGRRHGQRQHRHLERGPAWAGPAETAHGQSALAVPGRFCDTASVATAQGLKESAQACTEWIGVTGVLVEVVDDPDPIQVGETTTFTIRVTNQGSTRDIENMNVKSIFAEQMDPTTASARGAASTARRSPGRRCRASRPSSR